MRRCSELPLAVGVLIVAGAVSSAPAQEPTDAAPVGYTVLQESPDRLIVELPNRLLVVAQQLDAAPVVSAQVWVKTGSIYEQEHVGAGLSHLLEHLASAGTTTTRSEAESNRLLGLMGAETNAGTSLDSVSYYINTTAPHAEQAIELLSDWMLHSKIEPQELAREKEVILREFEMGQGDPGRILWTLTQEVRYDAHPARHPTIGYLDEFQKIEREQVVDFYRRMYVPNNMVFVVVGDVDREAMVRQVARLWAEAPARELPKLSFPVEPPPGGTRQAAGFASIQRPRLRLAWPSTRLGAPGDYELDLLAGILGRGEASRLARTVRDRAQVVTEIDAYHASFSWGEGFFGIDADVAAGVEPAKEKILAEVRHLLAAGITEEELATAKRQVLAAVAMSGQTAEGLASRLANNIVDTGDPDYHHRYAEKIQAITADAVVEAGRRYLVPERLMTVTLEPAPEGTSLELRNREAEASAAADLPREPVEIDNRRIAERVRASARKREARAVETTPIETFVLPNGLRVLIGRSTLVPAVAVEIYHLGGLLADPPARPGIANAAAEMRMRGTETRSAEELAREVESLGATIGTGSGNNTTFTRAVGLAEDLPRIVDLVADVTLRPSFPVKEWQVLRSRLVAAIDARTDHWTSEIATLFREAWYDGTPWETNSLGRREVVEALTAGELRQAYFERLGAETAVLAVLGDVDPARVKELVAGHFGEMPRAGAVAFVLPEFEEPARTIVTRVSNKPLAALHLGLGPTPARHHGDFATLQVLAEALGAFPYGWLPQELRGLGQGLVYAVSAFQFAGLGPGYFGVLWNADVEQLSTALERTVVVLDRVRTEGVAAEDLERAKAAVLAAEFLHKQALADRAGDAALNLLYGMDLEEPDRFAERVRAIDAAALRDAARRYLRNPVAVVLAPRPVDESAIHRALGPLLGDPAGP
ncbi:MAG TPA: pitrilysin family protein [Thermoanaerobaculia bacterium]|nr:pitrilysin family protein [Thermoanaerobaculia bacterium]